MRFIETRHCKWMISLYHFALFIIQGLHLIPIVALNIHVYIEVSCVH